MALLTRDLDDRKFQNIVDEAKKRITASCPEWTDHNVSDPGVTLVELFAWMTDMIIYRLNQVPEKNYIKFLEFLGLRLREPEPAIAPLTFYLSAPQPLEVTIPTGTEAATLRTETRPSVLFSTEEDLILRPPVLMAMFSRDVTSGDGEKAKDERHPLQQLGIASFPAFGKKPTLRNALFLGFENDVSNHVLGLQVTCPTATSLGIDPKNPPWKWEGWFGGEGERRWLPVVVEEDETGGLSKPGRILLRLPRLVPREFIERRGYWVRCSVDKATSGRDYDASPVINNLTVSTWGGTVRATHASVVHHEFLGRSDGSPGQVFHAEHLPLLRRKPGETVEVLAPGAESWEPWKEVANFSESDQEDKHFTCDSATGEIRFGPALRLPEGKAQSFGAIPPRLAQVRFSSYRYGGGVEGNVQTGELRILKTSIPYVDRTYNHADATGGFDPETIELLQLRAPKTLGARGRAVTAQDFEDLACDADKRVYRARCVQSPTIGQVYVLLVPKVNLPEGRIAPEQLLVSEDLRESVRRELDQRRLLTVKIEIHDPEYVWVAVAISVVANPNVERLRVQGEIERRLYAYLNPIKGGPDGKGWPFGRDLYPSDVYTCLQGVPGIEFVESLRLYTVQPKTREKTDIPGPVKLLSHALIASAEHEVQVTYMK